MGFSRIAVGKFVDQLEKVYNNQKLRQHRILNVNETDLSKVPKSHSKILTSYDQRQLETMNSAERGKLMTAIVCFSAVSTDYMSEKVCEVRIPC